MIKCFIGVTLVTIFILRFPVRVARETANFFLTPFVNSGCLSMAEILPLRL